MEKTRESELQAQIAESDLKIQQSSSLSALPSQDFTSI
jgi:hypothetical protein